MNKFEVSNDDHQMSLVGGGNIQRLGGYPDVVVIFSSWAFPNGGYPKVPYVPYHVAYLMMPVMLPTLPQWPVKILIY